MIRYEILLPLYLNDGAPVAAERFLETDDELLDAFGAISTDTVVIKGKWTYQSTIYHDQLIRIRIDADESPEVEGRIRQIKETLKTRFERATFPLWFWRFA